MINQIEIHIQIPPTSYAWGLVLRSTVVVTASWKVLWGYSDATVEYPHSTLNGTPDLQWPQQYCVILDPPSRSGGIWMCSNITYKKLSLAKRNHLHIFHNASWLEANILVLLLFYYAQ